MIHYRLTSALIFGALTACSASDIKTQNTETGDVKAAEIKTPQFTAPDYDTAPLDLSTPQSTAYSVMVAMYRGDTEMLDAIFIEDSTLYRAKPDGSLPENGIDPWLKWVGTLETGQMYEDIFALKVEEIGDLATVWAPFVYDYKGETFGCGMNQFSMAKVGGDWRILSGVDTPAPPETCATFKETTLAQ